MDFVQINNLTVRRSHFPQCNCNFKHYFRKTINSMFSFPETTCPVAQKWCEKAKVPINSNEFYESLLKLNFDKDVLQHSNRQIDLDLPRTFANYPYFSKGNGLIYLKRLLYAFNKYNPKLGYVQGMNYIAASLLYHCTEADAFWLFLRLVYDYNLVENYLPNLPGLEKHAHILEFLMMEELPELNEHLLQQGVIVQMYTTEWCLTLFTSLLNLEYAAAFLKKFFKYRWIFFYKFVLEILHRLQKKLMNSSNTMKILDILKPLRTNSVKASLVFLKTLENGEKITWEELAFVANQRKINEVVVMCLMDNFEHFNQDMNQVRDDFN